MANKFTKQMEVSKVPQTKTSVDVESAPKPSELEPVKEVDPLTQYSKDDLKDVVVLSVKLPHAVRSAIRQQCAAQNIKLATEAKKWMLERFELPEGFTAEAILEDKRIR